MNYIVRGNSNGHLVFNGIKYHGYLINIEVFYNYDVEIEPLNADIEKMLENGDNSKIVEKINKLINYSITSNEYLVTTYYRIFEDIIDLINNKDNNDFKIIEFKKNLISLSDETTVLIRKINEEIVKLHKDSINH